MNLGATVIDMGGGTTSLAVFYDGKLMHADSVPLGGSHVTSDIARGLSTPVAHAERMKTLYGSAMASPSDERETIDVPLVGEENRSEANHVPRSILVSIIRPRIEEIFELIRSRLEASGFDRVAGRRVVLTGGASHFGDMAGTTRPVAVVSYYEDESKVENLPEGFFSSEFYTDRIMDYIDSNDDEQPFMAYLSYTAAHWPLQVPDDWLDRYANEYEEGWHAVRESRFNRQQDMGIIPAHAQLSAGHRAVEDWEGLLPAQPITGSGRLA